MKSFKIVSVIVIAGLLLTVAGCKKSHPTPPSDQEVQLGLLSKTWKVKTVKLDGTDKTTDYKNFVLVFSGTPGATSYSYTTSGRPANPTRSPWLASGTWTYGTDPLSDIIRDSGADLLNMKYSVSDTQLVISFTFTGDGYPGARTEVVKGLWEFTFTL